MLGLYNALTLPVRRLVRRALASRESRGAIESRRSAILTRRGQASWKMTIGLPRSLVTDGQGGTLSRRVVEV